MLIIDRLLNQLNGSNNIHELLQQLEPLDLIDDNEPRGNDTIGELISKLSCATVQMWENQNVLYKIRFMQQDEFIKAYGNCPLELYKIIKRACDLNVQRSRLVDAIDKKILGMKNGYCS